MKIINSISCYCDSEEKINALKENILFFKQNNIDSAIISPIPVPEEIQEIVKYCFITDHNPVFDWPVHCYSLWQVIHNKGQNIRLTTTKPDYGWTTVSHIEKMGGILLDYGYDNIIFTIYDAKVKQSHIDEITNNEGNMLFPSIRGNDFFGFGLHLLYLNKIHFNKFTDLLNVEDYLSQNGLVAAYIQNKLNDNGYVYSNIAVEDKIFRFEDTDAIFNISTNEDFKMFISSTDHSKVSILVYHIDSIDNIKLFINGIEHYCDENNIYHTNLSKNEVKEAKVVYKSIESNFIDKIKEVKHSFIEIL